MAACSSLASVGKVMAFGSPYIDRDPLEVLAINAPASCAPQALSQQQQLVAEPLAPMAQVERSCGLTKPHQKVPLPPKAGLSLCTRDNQSSQCPCQRHMIWHTRSAVLILDITSFQLHRHARQTYV